MADSETLRNLRREIAGRFSEIRQPGAMNELATEFDVPAAVVWNLYARLEEARHNAGAHPDEIIV